MKNNKEKLRICQECLEDSDVDPETVKIVDVEDCVWDNNKRKKK